MGNSHARSIDTRAVVKKIRNEGTMPVVLSNSNIPNEDSFQLLDDLKVSKVTTFSPEHYGDGEQPYCSYRLWVLKNPS